MPRATKEASRETARSILDVATVHFRERGFDGSDLVTIAAEVGVTRGAIYHHYPNKLALFAAVVARLHTHVQQQVETAAAPLVDPWDQLIVGCEAFFDAAIDPSISRILLIEAPSVLGWDQWRKLDESTSFASLTDVMRQLEDAGDIPRGSAEASAHLLSGAMNEAVLWFATSPNAIAAKSQVMTSLTAMILGLGSGA